MVNPEKAYDFVYGNICTKFKKKFKTSTKANRMNNIITATLNEQEAFIFKQAVLYGFSLYRVAHMNSMDKRYVVDTFRRALRKLRTPSNVIEATGIKIFTHEGEAITDKLISTRVHNILKRHGIQTVGDLRMWASTSAAAFFNIPGIGIQTIPRLIAICEPSLY